MYISYNSYNFNQVIAMAKFRRIRSRVYEYQNITGSSRADSYVHVGIGRPEKKRAFINSNQDGCTTNNVNDKSFLGLNISGIAVDIRD